jgi:hypothetical protein
MMVLALGHQPFNLAGGAAKQGDVYALFALQSFDSSPHFQVVKHHP